MVGLGVGSPARVEGIRATFIGNMAFHITDGTVALITAPRQLLLPVATTTFAGFGRPDDLR